MDEKITMELTRKEVEAVLDGLIIKASEEANKFLQYEKDAKEAKTRCAIAYSTYDKIKQYLS